MDADRVLAGDLDVTSIGATGELMFSGLSAGAAISSKYLALDANNNVVLTTAAGEEANFNSISGSILTYHNMSDYTTLNC